MSELQPVVQPIRETNQITTPPFVVATLTPEQVAEQEKKRAADEAWEKHVSEWRAQNRRKDIIKREKGRKRMLKDVAMRREFFAQVSLEGLTPEYMESNEALFRVFDELDTLMLELERDDLPEDQRRNMGGQMYRKTREARRLMRNQRRILLNDFAQVDLGVDANQIPGLITFIETVEDVTGTVRRAGLSDATKQTANAFADTFSWESP